MKIKNTNFLILGLLIAVSSCGKHPLPKKSEEGGGAPKTDTAASTAGDAEKTAAAKAEADRKKALEEANKKFRVFGGETQLSKLFEAFQAVDGDKVKVEAITASLVLGNKDEAGEVTSIVGTLDAKSELKTDQPLCGLKQLWNTSVIEYKKDKTFSASTVKNVKNESGRIKLSANGTDSDVALPVLKVDLKNIQNLVLDSSRDVVADSIEIADATALGEGSECAVVVSSNKDNKTAPAGLILTHLIKDGKVDFASVKKEDLATVISDGKPVDAYFVCANIQKAADANQTQLLFTQKAIKLTIKAAPAAAPATPKP